MQTNNKENLESGKMEQLNELVKRINSDREVNYWRTTKMNYYRDIENILRKSFDFVDDYKHPCSPSGRFSVPNLVHIIEHTDYACNVLSYCKTCGKIVEYYG